MFDSQVIIATGTGGTTVVYSPWFPRGGDHGIFGLEVSAWSESNSGTKLGFSIFHKFKEDAGDGQVVGSESTDKLEILSNSSAPWRSTRDWSASTSRPFKELVRFKITFTASGSTQWAIFRILSPVWFDAVKV